MSTLRYFFQFFDSVNVPHPLYPYIKHDIRVEEVASERDVGLVAEVDVHPLQLGPHQRVAEPEGGRGELGEHRRAARAVVACGKEWGGDLETADTAMM